MNIIGLGNAGCKIADVFSQHPQYKIFKIDVDISGDRCYNIPKFEQAEEYEQYRFPKLKSFFKGTSGKTVHTRNDMGEPRKMAHRSHDAVCVL